MPKRGKNPAKRVRLVNTKLPSQGVDVDRALRTERLSWGLSILDLDGGCFSWSQCGFAKLGEVHEQLCHHEKMSLTEFFTRNGTNKIAVDRLSRPARKRMVELNLDDAEELFEFRLGATERIWGTMTGSVFNLLWWDPDHKVYLVRKKYT